MACLRWGFKYRVFHYLLYRRQPGSNSQVTDSEVVNLGKRGCRRQLELCLVIKYDATASKNVPDLSYWSKWGKDGTGAARTTRTAGSESGERQCKMHDGD